MNSTIATLTSKNQLTLPVGIVDDLLLSPGTRMWIKKEKNSIVLEKIGSLREIQGILAESPLSKKYSSEETVLLARKAKVARLFKK